MSPADFRRRRLPVTRGVGFHPRRRTSQVPGLTFGVRCPQPPREARRLNVPVATPPVPGRPYFGRKATSVVCNEAESGSMLAAHAFDFQGFDAQVTPSRRLVAYMSNGLFTWPTPLSQRVKSGLS